MLLQILPAVGGADEPDRAGQPRHRTGHRQRYARPFGKQHWHAFELADACRIAAAGIAKMRSEQHVQVKIGRLASLRLKSNLLQNGIPGRIGNNLLYDLIAVLVASVR